MFGRKFLKYLLASLIASAAIVGVAHALPIGTVVVSKDQVYKTYSNGANVTCALVKNKWAPGKLVNKTHFLTYTQNLKNDKKDVKTAVGKTKAKLQKEITSISGVMAAHSAACIQGRSGNNPIAAPTPPPATGNFDDLGNVTPAGKIAFAIPSDLSGNITTGKELHTRLACTSCHGERTGRSYANVKTAMATVSAMRYFEEQTTDQDVANIIAFLNRFKS